MHRPLVAIAVASPIVVGGLAVVLAAHALAHSWLWGAVAAALAAALFATLVAVMIRWSRTHPGVGEIFIEGFARATTGFPVPRSDRDSRRAQSGEDRSTRD